MDDNVPRAARNCLKLTHNLFPNETLSLIHTFTINVLISTSMEFQFLFISYVNLELLL